MNLTVFKLVKTHNPNNSISTKGHQLIGRKRMLTTSIENYQSELVTGEQPASLQQPTADLTQNA